MATSDGESAWGTVQVRFTDWYDGATAGVMEARKPAGVFAFEMLDWNSSHRVRIFGMRKSQGNLSFEEAVEASAARIHEGGDSRRQDDQPYGWVIAWDNQVDRVLAAREITPDDRATIGDWSIWMDRESPPVGWDWFNYLGIEDARSLAP